MIWGWMGGWEQVTLNRIEQAINIPSHTPGSDEQEQFDFDHVIVGKQKSLWDFHDLDL